ncbi:MAG: LPP20 family lipoprotein [Candidatus Auribacterota bacterium]|jgi:hypothetical protein|nr:LPP20 family lipoprotein [Candidatus Auribacterota bacterium]
MYNLRCLFSVFGVVTCFFLTVRVYADSPKITELNGDVRHKQESSDTWQSAKAGVELASSDSLKTGVESNVDVAFDLVNLFRLQPESELIVGKIPESLDEGAGVERLYRFSLLGGSMISKLDKLPKETRYEVETPVAIAGARGTAFVVRASSEGCQFTALENNIEIQCRASRQKQVVAGPYRQVSVATWETVSMSAEGTGVLSEAILGKMIGESMDKIYIRAEGTSGKHPEIEDVQKRESLMRIEARRNAEDQLAGMITEIKIGPEKNLADMLFDDTALAGKLFQMVSEASVVETVSNDDGTVTVILQLGLEQIQRMCKEKLNVWKSVRQISRSQYMQDYPAVARVTTERAAKLDAYRRLAEKIYGTVITSDTRVRDMTLERDTVTNVVEGMVQGAKVVQTTYYSDGSVKVMMVIDGSLVKNRLSEASSIDMGLHYVSSPELISYTDYRFFEVLREME